MGDELKSKWDMIPDDVNILITHGPPNEIRDFVSNWRQGDMNVGCELLRHQLDNRIKPVLHVFGHIHGAYGAALIKDTLYVNASTCTERYEPTNKPIIVDLTEVDGKLIATYVEE
jgi:Icc-related predicted phosphoesterase